MFVGKAKNLPDNSQTLDQAGKACQNCTLLRTLVNYGCKKFYNVGPRLKTIHWERINKGLFFKILHS